MLSQKVLGFDNFTPDGIYNTFIYMDWYIIQRIDHKKRLYFILRDIDNMRIDFLVDVDFDIDFVNIDETIKEDIYLRGYQ